MPFEKISSLGIYTPAMLSGGGASGVVAYGSWDGYGHWPLRFLRHDAARPDEPASPDETFRGRPPS